MNATHKPTRHSDVPQGATRRPNSQGTSVGAHTGLIAGAFSTILIGSLAAAAVRAEEPTLKAEEPMLETVVVTAQRRAQNLQEVPLSIAVFTAQQLSEFRIEQAGDLASYTPGLNASTSQFGDPIFSLRGVGMNNGNSNQNPAVTEYVNEVAVPTVAMLGFQLFDLERVEVLKGPQGDLYGRNTTGGAINFVTARPTQQFGASAEMSYGNYNLAELDAMVNGGVSDTLAVRVAAHTVSRDGWQTIIATNNLGGYTATPNGAIEREAVRLSALWKPSDVFQALFVGDASFDNSQVVAEKSEGYRNTDGTCKNPLAPGYNGGMGCPVIAISPATGQAVTVSDASNSPLVGFGASSYGNRNKVHLYGGNLTMDWMLHRMNLTSVTGARKMNRDRGSSSASPFIDQDMFRTESIDTLSQELRLASDNSWGPLQWLVGAYYSRDKVDDVSLYNFAANRFISGIFNEDISQTTRTGAVFAHAEFQLSNEWKIITGLRDTHENKDFAYSSGVNDPAHNPVPVPFFQDSMSSNGVSGKVGLNYTPNKDILVYLTFGDGFKSGGYAGDIAFDNVVDLTPYKSESLHSYELGLKSTLAGGTVQLNSAAYYYDWRDMQASTEVTRGLISVITLGNAGNVKIYGLDTDLVWTASPEFTFRAGLNLTHAKIVSGLYNGMTPVQAPKVSTNLIASYQASHPIGSVLPFAQLDYNSRSSVYFTLPNVAADSQGAYGLLGLRAGLRTHEKTWEWSAWARNLANKAYLADAFGSGSSFLSDRYLYAEPRTFGLSIRHTF